MVKAISVIGLGKLGLSMAACFASRGYRVIGIEIDRNKADLVNKGESPIQETGLAKLIGQCTSTLRATSDYREGILETEVTFVVVGTPSEADGSFSNEQLEQALKQVGLALRDKKSYHLVVITSTVMPGTTEHVGKFVLEKFSGKKCGKGFGIA